MVAITNSTNATLPRSKRLTWEAELAIPQTADEAAQNIARSIAYATEMLKDPFYILKRAIFQSLLLPEVIQAAQYTMLLLTFFWNIATFGITTYFAFQLCRATVYIIERLCWCLFGGVKKNRSNIFKHKKKNPVQNI